MLFRLILPDWAKEQNPEKRKVLEGQFSEQDIEKYNQEFYNIYYLPNHPAVYEGGAIDGFHIDTFNYCFVDMDLKDGTWPSKQAFIEYVANFSLTPTRIVDSGYGIHAYWAVSDLSAMSYLKLQRRLMRHFKTDEAVGQIYQLMRLWDTINTKRKDGFEYCETLYSEDATYTCEQLDKALPAISFADEEYCKQHYNKTYKLNDKAVVIEDKIPLKFAKLLDSNPEVKDIWSGNLADRSKGDYRLAHIMFASNFTKDEATAVLVNSAKALARAPTHRLSYATNIVDKIWTYEISEDKTSLNLSSSVAEIITANLRTDNHTRFPCNRILDATHKGFKLSQVFGLVGGSGVGKTTFALNMFRWFAEANPDYVHFFISLEQPPIEIATRWTRMCGDNQALSTKVQVIGNYNEDGTYRNLSLNDIKDYILKFQAVSGKKAGCVVIDHIGILKKSVKDGEMQGLTTVCQGLKSFAVETNTFLVIQSQTSREKAGIGDLELNKDAAYGTTTFEWYCDFLVTIWAPLKRIYDKAPHMTVTAFKYCKIRDKNIKLDSIKEDCRYVLMLDPDNEKFRELTQEEEVSFNFFNNQATNLRKQDRKTDVLPYTSITWNKD